MLSMVLRKVFNIRADISNHHIPGAKVKGVTNHWSTSMEQAASSSTTV